MEMVFACGACGRALTAPLRELPAQLPPQTEDGQDFVPRGYFTRSDGEYFTGTEGRLVVSLKDVRGTRHHADLHRLNGCCGLDGLDGPNTVCGCGAVVGTEKSDCWMAHALLLEPGPTTATAVPPG